MTDIWALGICLFQLLCGTYPFYSKYLEELCRKIKIGYFECPDYLSQDATELIKKILVLDPKKRPNAEEVNFF